MATVAAGAFVDPTAELADDVVVGRHAIIEAGCRIDSGCRVGAHVIIWRGTQMGKNNRIFPFCSIGAEPQDKKFKGEETMLLIGDGNTIREYCSLNRGTALGGGETRIDSNNWIMAYVHVAHDCLIGNNVIIANCAQFAGHVEIDDGAVIGGGALFHQFRRVGTGAMVGGGETMRQDVPPYALVARGAVVVNAEGMRRSGFSPYAIARIKEAFRRLYHDDVPLAAARQHIAGMADEENGMAAVALRRLTDFLHLEKLVLARPVARA